MPQEVLHKPDPAFTNLLQNNNLYLQLWEIFQSGFKENSTRAEVLPDEPYTYTIKCTGDPSSIHFGGCILVVYVGTLFALWSSF